MANPEHLKVLEKGLEAWNEWRKACKFRPDLSGADLGDANLSGADLGDANLTGANLAAASLSEVNLIGATLVGANLSEANLSAAILARGDLSTANLIRANLSGADLGDANLSGGDLGDTNLVAANLVAANLTGANLTGANLTGANLRDANLSDVNLSGACFEGARLGWTIFANLDLSGVAGLNSARHAGASTIGIDTLYKSGGRISDKFLRDAGVPDDIIDVARMIRNGPPIQWHSCFISYSTKDEEFARRLHSRMREANMRVWFAPEDMKGGEKLHEQLFRAVQLYDKLLLVLSPTSMKSEWVMTEIRRARETERKEKRRKLFPIRLVEFDALRDWTCFDADSGKDLAVEVREYFIPDFSNWKDHDSFEAAFKRLQRDLQAEGSIKVDRWH